MQKLILASVLFLGGCAQSVGWNKGTAQPRALLHSIEMPFCIFVCQISASITSTEPGNAGTVSGGDLQATQVYAPVTTKNNSGSSGGSAPAPAAP
jgi:hypothetical protein